jgi:hypothetical protein
MFALGDWSSISHTVSEKRGEDDLNHGAEVLKNARLSSNVGKMWAGVYITQPQT